MSRTLECTPVDQVDQEKSLSALSGEITHCPYCTRAYQMIDADEDGMIYCDCGGDLDVINKKALWRW